MLVWRCDEAGQTWLLDDGGEKGAGPAWLLAVRSKVRR